MPSLITSLNQLETFSIAALHRSLQAGGNLRMYCRDMSMFKSPTGRRQTVKVPRTAVRGALAYDNPESGLDANGPSVANTEINWNQGSNSNQTSLPLAISYDRWELATTGIAPELIAQHAAVQVTRYEQRFDSDCVAHLEGSSNWGATANQTRVTIAKGSTPTSAEIKNIVTAMQGIPWQYWRRGMTRRPGSDDDGSPQREIICVLNVRVMQHIMAEYFDDVAVGAYATQSSTWLQSTLGPMLGGMTLVVSHGMDDGLTGSGDEYIAGTFLRGSMMYVIDDSPQIDAIGYTSAGSPTLEQRVGFFRDHGLQLVAANECYAVKANVTAT